MSSQTPLAAGQLTSLPKLPQRAEQHLIFCFTAGGGQHHIDFQPAPIQTHSLHLVRPGQLHDGQIEKADQGVYVAFAPELLAGGDLEAELTCLLPAGTPPVYPLSAAEAESIIAIMREIEAAPRGDDWGQAAASRAWLNLLLIRIERLHRRFDPSLTGPGGRLTSRFLRLVAARAIDARRLAPYAAQLGVTVGHLTETVRAVCGRPAGAILREQIALEAGRLLVTTDNSVAQVGAALAFRDPAYFGRFFRRETGRTPQEFRRHYSFPLE